MSSGIEGMRLAFCGNIANGYAFSVFEGVKDWLASNPEVTLLDWNGSNQIPVGALVFLRPDAILLGHFPRAEIPMEVESVPIVGFTNRLETDRLSLFVNDDREVGRMAAKALLEAGYSQFVALNSVTRAARARLDGFHEIMQAEGRKVECHTSEVRAKRDGENFAEVFAEHESSLRAFLRSVKPDSGIFCPLSVQVTHLFSLLREIHSCSIPEELGLIVGDLPHRGDLEGRIAHVRLNGAEVGRRACEQLYEAVRVGCQPEPCRIEIVPSGVEWGQTLRPRVGTDLFQALTAYCAPRLGESITVPDMARHLGLSRRALELKLHTLGLPSPFQQLLELRLRKGEQLLRESNLSIERVSELCGFSDVRSFTRRFRERHGCPPSRFRSRLG
jgi:AraC-like DNA-binding protein